MHVCVTAKNIICTIDRHRSVFLIALGSGQDAFKMSDESRQYAAINKYEMCLQYVTPVWKQSDINSLRIRVSHPTSLLVSQIAKIPLGFFKLTHNERG